MQASAPATWNCRTVTFKSEETLSHPTSLAWVAEESSRCGSGFRHDHRFTLLPLAPSNLGKQPASLCLFLEQLHIDQRVQKDGLDASLVFSSGNYCVILALRWKLISTVKCISTHHETTIHLLLYLLCVFISQSPLFLSKLRQCRVRELHFPGRWYLRVAAAFANSGTGKIPSTGRRGEGLIQRNADFGSASTVLGYRQGLALRGPSWFARLDLWTPSFTWHFKQAPCQHETACTNCYREKDPSRSSHHQPPSCLIRSYLK